MTDPILYDGDDEIVLPFKWTICSHCNGHGTSSAYLGAFTGDEMSEMDDEWREDYAAGRFDRRCDHCGGSGKIKVADTQRMTADQRKKYRAQQREDAETDAIERQERLMEGGWREEGW
jgi:hypothetical protein